MKISEIVKRDLELTKTLPKNPTGNLLQLMPSITVIVAFAIQLINYLFFVRDGGYAQQKIRPLEMEESVRAISSGIFNNAFEKTELPLFFLLILLSVFLILYQSLATSNKILVYADMITLAICTGLFVLFYLINFRKIELSESQYETMKNVILKLGNSGLQILLLGFLVLVLLSLGLLIYFSFKAKLGYMLKNLTIAALISRLAIPLIFFIIKNIISIASVGLSILLFLIVGVAILWFIGIFLFSGDSSTSTSSYHHTHDTHYTKRQDVKPLDIHHPDDNMWVIPSGIMVHKVHGTMHDYIERSNNIGGRSEVCSLHELQTGKFLIYDSKGRRIGENDIPWK